MRCLACGKLSLSVVCQTCASTFLVPNTTSKTLDCGLEVVSFFEYEEIEFLLKTKYEPVGYFVFRFLAKKFFRPFAHALGTDCRYSAVAIDDNPRLKGYSHTAILANAMQTENIIYKPNILRAQNSISYAGKPKSFRQQNPRNFKLNSKPNNIILIDDVITTGTTLCEAYETLDKNVEFALVLCRV